MARPSLKGNVTKPQAAEAAEVARKLAGGGKAAPEPTAFVEEGVDYEGEMETVSYHLPVELIELYRDLAEERLRVERAARRAGQGRSRRRPGARRRPSCARRWKPTARRWKRNSGNCGASDGIDGGLGH